MRLTDVALLLCACAWVSAGDIGHLKAKARLLGRLTGKHHKRGVLSGVPTYKLGHDIPHITHSVVKPVVVTYPPTASVTAVKLPLAHPLHPRYPVPVGHRVPVPYPHYGLKFPHHHTKVVLPNPDQHYHHHHHHVPPRPVIPVIPAVPATPVLPIAAPTFLRPIPVPSPPVALPTPVVQPAPVPTPVHLHPQPHLLRPLLPAPLPAPALNYASQFPYAFRPGNAVQTSFFANYARYPFLNYRGPVFPLGASSFSQIVPYAPQYPVPQQGAFDGVVIEQPGVQVEPTPSLIHAHGEVPQPGVHLEQQPGIHVHAAQPEVHLQPGHPGLHLHAEHPNFLQNFQPGVQHYAQPDVNLQPGVHVQPEVHLHGAQPDFDQQPGLQVNGPDVHFHAGQPGIQLQPGVHINAQPDIHFQAGQPGIQLQPGQPDIHFHAGQPGIQFQPGVQVDAAGQPDIHYHAGPGFNYQPGQTDFNYQPGQPDFHLQPNQPQPTQPTVDHNGWSPVTSQNNLGDEHYPKDGHHQFDQGHQQFDQGQHQFGQNPQQFDQGHQQFHDQGHHGYDQSAQDGYNDYQNQLQNHIQQQFEQAQYEQHVNNQQHLGQEYGAPQPGQSSQDFPQGNEYSNHQPGQEYGLPQQGAEGRSSAEGQTDEPEGDKQLYHNHIPLGLQPPIDRPLEHFR